MTTTRTVPPSARTVRRHLRRGRSAHRDTTIGGVLTDVYVVTLFIAMYGTALVAAVRRHLRLPPSGSSATADTRAWLILAATAVLAGLLWHAARDLGPLYLSPAARSWAAGAPIDRRAWLAPSFGWLLVAAAGLGGLLGGIAALVDRAGASAATAWLVTGTAAAGITGAAAAVVAQGGRRRSGVVGSVGVLIGTALAGAALLLHARRIRLPVPAVPASWFAASMLAAAAIAVGVAATRLGRLDMAALMGGAQLADAATLAVVMLQPSMLGDIVEARRWRRIGRVRSRRFVPPRGRVWTLLQADLRRQARRPAGLLTWLGLLLVPYAATLVAPAAVAPVRVVAGYLAAERLCAGLRAVCRSTSLRRSLGGADRLLYGIHLVVPGFALGLWWTLTVPAQGGTPVALVEVALACGVLFAVYRAASRQPTRYDVAVVDTPFGLVQPDLVKQLVRGLDALAVVALAAFLLR